MAHELLETRIVLHRKTRQKPYAHLGERIEYVIDPDFPAGKRVVDEKLREEIEVLTDDLRLQYPYRHPTFHLQYPILGQYIQQRDRFHLVTKPDHQGTHHFRVFELSYTDEMPVSDLHTYTQEITKKLQHHVCAVSVGRDDTLEQYIYQLLYTKIQSLSQRGKDSMQHSTYTLSVDDQGGVFMILHATDGGRDLVMSERVGRLRG